MKLNGFLEILLFAQTDFQETDLLSLLSFFIFENSFEV